MKTLVESISTSILLILAILLLMHLLNGTASAWLTSKVKVAGT